MHKDIAPAIHYWGTPVILISTLNEDGSANLAPMSSAWWLGWSCMLGLDASSQTTANLKRSGQCVLNLASVDNVAAVDRLAKLTGSQSVPLHKKLLGYRHEVDKFGVAGLSPQAAVDVAAPRVAECPVQLECVVQSINPFANGDPRMAIPACAIEVRIVRTHVAGQLLHADHPDRIDPKLWCPLIMSFREFYGLGAQLQTSRLAQGPEENYAPWKAGGLKQLAGKALSAWSRHRYGN